VLTAEERIRFRQTSSNIETAPPEARTSSIPPGDEETLRGLRFPPDADSRM